MSLEQEADTKRAAQVGARTANATRVALEQCLTGDVNVAEAALEAIRRLGGHALDWSEPSTCGQLEKYLEISVLAFC